HAAHPTLHSFPTRRSSDLDEDADVPLPDAIGLAPRIEIIPHMPQDGPAIRIRCIEQLAMLALQLIEPGVGGRGRGGRAVVDTERSEEHTSELQSRSDLVCR